MMDKRIWGNSNPLVAHRMLNDWYRVGEIFDPENGTIVTGFGKKYINRGELDHQHAGVYIDFTKLRLMQPKNNLSPSSHGFADADPNRGRFEEISNVFIKIGNLPETPFWEGDTVEIPNYVDSGGRADTSNRWVIFSTDYDYLGRKEIFCDAWNQLSNGKIDEQHSAKLPISSFSLLQRGNLWKMEHGEKVEFASIEEEALFYKSLGMSRNITANGNEVRMEIAMNALIVGEADQMKVKVVSGKEGRDFFFTLIKYDNEEFGKRMRANELKRLGFSEEVSA